MDEVMFETFIVPLKPEVNDLGVGDDEDSEDEGELVDLCDVRNIGYIGQYLAVGFVLGALPSTTYGVFNGYLNVPAYAYSAVTNMLMLPWTGKAFFGGLTDCLPIRGYRRKPYMLAGWIMSAFFLTLLSFQSLPEPYWCRDDDGAYITRCTAGMLESAGRACSHYNGHGPPVAARPCNAAAADGGSRLAAFMSLAVLGSVVADVAADGLTVSYAKREPIARRGHIQSTSYLLRSTGQTCAYVFVGFCMNSREYNGSFSWGLSFPTICGILAVPCALMAPFSWFCIQEEKVERAPHIGNYFCGIWTLMQSKAFFAVVLFSLLYSGISGISTNAGVMVQRYWVHVKNLQAQLFSIIGMGLFVAGLALTRRRLLNVSWRTLIVATTCFLTGIDSVFVSCAVFDVVRYQYFFLGEAILIEIPSAVQFLVTTFYVVEAADDENGGLVYGLLTTAVNIAKYTSPLISNQIFSLFQPSLSDAGNYIEDAPAFRNVVMWSYVLGYALTFASFVFLPLLPRQKADAQQRKRLWGHRLWYGVVSIVVLSVLFTYMVSMNVLTILPQTRCLQIVGGEGCS
eukprot:TRINITY_DN5807_c0_g1_i1.p1 TRINITY_DN5807_c0_g1~~TRINITY_DN5807_c0_g1_i1.p1  ORF type:complete len:569 (+),score=57.30 TRINITY_DN5807_c0_g1_i1:82-1788(+)